jgi:hypothetical protein
MLFVRDRRPPVKVFLTFSHALVEAPSPTRFEEGSTELRCSSTSGKTKSEVRGERSLGMREATDRRVGKIWGELESSLARVAEGALDKTTADDGEGGTLEGRTIGDVSVSITSFVSDKRGEESSYWGVNPCDDVREAGRSSPTSSSSWSSWNGILSGTADQLNEFERQNL